MHRSLGHSVHVQITLVNDVVGPLHITKFHQDRATERCGGRGIDFCQAANETAVNFNKTSLIHPGVLTLQPSKQHAEGKSPVSHHQPVTEFNDVATEGLEGQRPIQRGLEMEVNTVRWSVRIRRSRSGSQHNVPLAQPFGWLNIRRAWKLKRSPLDKGTGAEPFENLAPHETHASLRGVERLERACDSRSGRWNRRAIVEIVPLNLSCRGQYPHPPCVSTGRSFARQGRIGDENEGGTRRFRVSKKNVGVVGVENEV